MSRHAGRERRRMSARQLSRLMNLYPPLLGSGIRVRSFADDWSVARVELRLNRLNRNQHGTAFGGSINAMTDAFYPLLLMHQLGTDYVVWDKACEIEFRAPGTGSVFAEFEMPRDVVESIRAQAEGGAKVLRWFETDLHLADGTVVAHARRQVYVRRKRPSGAGAPTGAAQGSADAERGPTAP